MTGTRGGLFETKTATPAPPIRRDRTAHLWVGAETISATGDALFTIALAWTAVRLFSPALAGLVIGIQTLPQALLTLAGGVLADRLDTRRVLIAGELMRAGVLVAGALAWSVWRSAVLLLILALLFGIIAGLSDPARGTLPRQLVRGDDLPILGGWTQIGGRLAVLAGSPLGALTVATAGLGPAMLIDAATFAATCAALASVVRPRWTLRDSATESWWVSLRQLRRYLSADATARTLTIGICALNVFVGPVTNVGVALRVARSHWSAAWVGIADLCFAVGAITGSAAAIRWRTGHIASRGFWALIMQGLALAAVGIGTRPSLVTAMTLVGITAGLASVWISSVFQRQISGAHLGRVTSVSQLGDHSMLPLMLPVFGILAGYAGVLTATVTFGAAMAALSLTIGLQPGIRSLT